MNIPTTLALRPALFIANWRFHRRRLQVRIFQLSLATDDLVTVNSLRSSGTAVLK
jgi:hypothetical protein